ncbi:MAG: hypothetical protein AAFY60_10305 [Myxococcota bacterium]
MIRIGSTASRRTFSPEDIQEMIPVLQRLSRRAADRAVAQAKRYGRLRESEPEWSVLKHELREIIQSWSSQVARLGAEPCELWTVGFRTESGVEYWRYEREDDPLARRREKQAKAEHG